MQLTGNYNLKKPEGTDVVNIQDFNDNADIMDAQLKLLNDNKVDKESGKGLSTNDYTTTEKNKLAGIAAGANNYVHPSTHPASLIVEDSTHRFVTDSEKASWNGKASTEVATTSANGLMSIADKTKLNGIATGAEVNQNAFSNVKVGSTTIASDTKSDTLELVAGANVTLTPDATNDKITISSTDTIYTHPSTHPATMITEDATHRFMTDAERTKITGIEAGAQVNTVTSVAGKTGVVVVSKSDVGLSSVQNYGLATQAEAEAGTSDAKYMTPLKTKQAILKLAPTPTTSSLTITDSGNYFGSNNVEGALQEIGQTLNGVRGSLIDSVNEILNS